MIRRRPFHASLALAALTSCAGAPAPPPPVVLAISSATPSTAAAPPTVAATAAPAPTAAPAKPPASGASPRHKIALTLRPGDPPCTLAFDGELIDDKPEWFSVTSVSRIATEEGGACKGHVLFDVAEDEKRRKPDEGHTEPLEAGIFQKPGQTMPADMSDAAVWNVTEDIDFDGYADLCVVTMTGSYNYGQNCWIFDPRARTFTRHEEVDYVIFMTIDRKNKKLTNRIRAGGPIYSRNEYAWQKGKLVQTLEETHVLGQRLDGSPLPNGFSYHVIRRELRNGKLVKTFDRPVKDAP